MWKRLVGGALVLLLFGVSAATAEIQTTGIEEGVPCDPPRAWGVVDERFTREPQDPSMPEINPLPTSVLVIENIALAPDVVAEDRVELGDNAFVPCRPSEQLREDEGEPLVRDPLDPLPEG